MIFAKPNLSRYFRGRSGRLSLLLALPLLCGLAVCHRVQNLAVSETYFCDLFENGICQDRREDDRVYVVKVPAFKQKSWYELGYHMYFHTRETPGLRLVFNRDLSAAELELLEQNLRCSYELEQGDRRYSGHLEGVRVDEEGVWCFDYLGTMLVRFHKEAGTEHEPPRPEFFPIKLTLQYESAHPALRGARQGLVIVRWRDPEISAEKKGFKPESRQ